jgi:hypothetical protein
MNLAKIISIFLLSSTKFLLGVGAVLLTDYSFGKAFSVIAIGGIAGVIFYLFLFNLIVKFTQKRGPKIKFSKWRRFMIHLKQKGGLLGIAALTPIILSIPLGIALSISLQAKKRNILLTHCISIVFWSVTLLGVKHYLGYDLPFFK